MGMNTLNLPQVSANAQAYNRNAMNMKRSEKEFAEQDRVANTKWQLSVAQNGMNMLEQNPEQLRSYMQMMDKDGQRRGVWEKLGIDYANMSDQELFQAAGQGFENMGQQAQIGLMGMQQPERNRYQDVNGYNRDSRTNERLNPDLVKDPTGSGQPSRQQWEYDTVVQQATDAGQDPPSYSEWLSEDPRRQSSAAMQAYNSYLTGIPEGQNPMSEKQYAATRAGSIAGAKKEGAGMAQRELDLPQAFSLHSQTTQNFTRLTDAATTLQNNDALWKAVGLSKSLAAVPGQEGADIRAQIQNIKSQVGFMVLQDMRNASKTGGALGQVSEKENELLQDNLASLDVNQSPAQFQRNLGIVVDYLSQAQNRLDRAWELTYPNLDTFGREKTTPTNAASQAGAGGQATPTGRTATDPNTGQRVQEMSDGTWQ